MEPIRWASGRWRVAAQARARGSRLPLTVLLMAGGLAAGLILVKRTAPKLHNARTGATRTPVPGSRKVRVDAGKYVIYSILAAERTGRLRRLTIYEPPIGISERSLQPLDHLIASGDHSAALETFLSFAGAPDEQLSAIRSSPAWPNLVTAVPTLSRELHASAPWRHPRGPIDVATLWLQGADTNLPAYLKGLDDLQGAFPALRLELITDQSHFAHVFAAESFVESCRLDLR
jgi:hypothetical protein